MTPEKYASMLHCFRGRLRVYGTSSVVSAFVDSIAMEIIETRERIVHADEFVSREEALNTYDLLMFSQEQISRAFCEIVEYVERSRGPQKVIRPLPDGVSEEEATHG